MNNHQQENQQMKLESSYSSPINQNQLLKLTIFGLTEQVQEYKVLINKLSNVLKNQNTPNDQLTKIEELISKSQLIFNPQYPKIVQKTQHQIFLQDQLQKQLKRVQQKQVICLQLEEKLNEMNNQKLDLLRQMNAIRQRMEEEIKTSESFYKEEIERMKMKKSKEQIEFQNKMEKLNSQQIQQMTARLNRQFEEKLQVKEIEYQQFRSELEREIIAIKIEVDKKNQELREKMYVISDFEITVQNITKELNQLKNKYILLEEQISFTTQSKDQEIKILLLKIQQKNKQNDQFNRNIQREIQKNEQLNSQVKMMINEIERLNLTLQTKNNELIDVSSSSQERQMTLKKQLQNNEVQYKIFESEMTIKHKQLQIQLQQSQRKIIQLEQQHQNELKQIQTSEKHNYEQQMKTKLLKLQKIGNDKEQSVNKIKQNLIQLNLQLSKQREKTQLLQKEKEMLENKLKQLSNDLQNLANENSSKYKDNNQLMAKYLLIEKQKFSLTNINHANQQEINRLSIQRQNQLSAMNQMAELNKTKNTQYAELIKQLEICKKQKEKVKIQTINQIKASEETFKKQSQILKNQLNQCYIKIKVLQNQKDKSLKEIKEQFYQKQTSIRNQMRQVYIQKEALEKQKRQREQKSLMKPQIIPKNNISEQNNQHIIEELTTKCQESSQKAAKYKKYYNSMQTKQGIFKNLQQYPKMNKLSKKDKQAFISQLIIIIGLLNS